MKVHRFLTITSIITTVALLYVNQQITLIRLSYDIKEQEKTCSFLLDRNKILLYNIEHLESPHRLEEVLLANNIELEVPSKERIILVSATPEKPGTSEIKKIARATGPLGKVRQAIASIFVLGSEAQARPVK
ncbi:MAG: hypothetical protein AMJ78_04320 [Omnitrophica WOR_2 bacterium SM23_29]|nr:MAG: hypothetical protein AMJ78_04320 [Omnitrophica WOR_2 bacterium SM23_29]